MNFRIVLHGELGKGVAVGVPFFPLPSMTVCAWLEFRNTAYWSLPDRYFRS